ncbi:hypothetical protein BS636_07140 [Acinetobacter sp. LoGeW2-3]|uniref:hypothetical protein n=1 Tax=Acinetobacter sp. LoGeW2-3 TaxID=1808001 RepID=UPI000C058DF0|nr:hypothetical protein [Acinetobacter sp. LoGeW2-3]ATO19449.1 hypothetical protein BS636_07140 [Acinetobacter sp. LoGeW2-3]
MSTNKNISDAIKEIYVSLHFLEEKYSLAGLEKYPHIIKIFKEFDDSDKEWRYFYKLENHTVLLDLASIFRNFLANFRDDLLPRIEELSKKLLSQLVSVRSQSAVFQGYEIDCEEILQNRLRYIHLSEELAFSLKRCRTELKDLENKIDKVEDQRKETLSSYKDANLLISELKTKKELLNKITDEVTNSEIKKLYDEIYMEEILIANKYRNWALGIFLIIGIILIFGFLNVSIQNWNHLRDSNYIYIPLDWGSLVKTLMLFSLTTPAWYLARESSKHRQVAYKARMLGTELSSFPLYAREFKDEDRLELRKILADRFFGQELYNDSKASSNSDNSLEQIKLLNEANKVLAESLKIKKVAEGS